MKQFKIFMLVSVISLFTTYTNAAEVNMAPITSYLLSDTATATPTPEEIAIDKIKAYADDDQANPAPVIQDYIDAGVTGVTSENIADVNSNIADKMASEVDTTEEIQAVVDSVLDKVSFASDVMPIFVADCQSCHTTATSKNRFVVSDAASTHDNIITNSLIDTASPDLSLILTKGNEEVSHNGGDVLTDENSQIVRDWIEQGGLNN